MSSPLYSELLEIVKSLCSLNDYQVAALGISSEIPYAGRFSFGFKSQMRRLHI
ncbi:MAG: hypothetical protein RLY14_1461 [Planctomycetota bacterium]|jgi:hypothetical protein